MFGSPILPAASALTVTSTVMPMSMSMCMPARTREDGGLAA
jgi:hypothetical protein